MVENDSQFLFLSSLDGSVIVPDFSINLRFHISAHRLLSKIMVRNYVFSLTILRTIYIVTCHDITTIFFAVSVYSDTLATIGGE